MQNPFKLDAPSPNNGTNGGLINLALRDLVCTAHVTRNLLHHSMSL
jgi:hypothetical protein